VKAEILRRTDLVALVRETVELRKAGAAFVGRCPFHAEKTPSFNVHPARGIFHCFGCGVGGDAFAFLMQRDGLSFPEALRLLAERTGVRLEEHEQTPEEEERARRQRDLRDWVLRANELAALFWEGCLWSTGGEAARRYLLERRGITEQTARAYRLGYAPESWDALASHLRARGIPERLLGDTGLLKPRERGGFYDAFRHRVLMPVFDVQGRLIAFSGRTLDPDPEVAKYINSPETPVFRKGESLFGLREARSAIRKQGYALLVEGNFDMLTLHQAGFTQAVAPLGTALTLEQVQLLRRFTDRIVVCYDGDRAGRAASLKAAPLMAEAEIDARRVELPAGEDPDSFVRRQGPEPLQRLIEGATPLVEAFIRAHSPGRRSPIEERLKAWEQISPVLGKVRHPLALQRYLALAADLLELDEKQLHGYIARPVIPVPRADARRSVRAGTTGEEVDQVARHLLELLVEFPSLAPQAEAAGVLELLPDQPLKEALKVFFSLLHEEGAPSAVRLLDALPAAPVRGLVQGLLARSSVFTPESAPKALEDVLRSLQRRELRHDAESNAALADADRAGDDERVMAELRERLRRVKDLHRVE